MSGPITNCNSFPATREKDGLRAKKGIFLGYDEEALCYLFYDPRSKSIPITGHVSFNEDLSSKQQKTAAKQMEYEALYEAFTVQGESEDQTAGKAAEVVPPGVLIQLTPPAASAASVSDRRVTHPDRIHAPVSTPAPCASTNRSRQ